jgi:hypothetical protein
MSVPWADLVHEGNRVTGIERAVDRGANDFVVTYANSVRVSFDVKAPYLFPRDKYTELVPWAKGEVAKYRSNVTGKPVKNLIIDTSYLTPDLRVTIDDKRRELQPRDASPHALAASADEPNQAPTATAPLQVLLPFATLG